MSFFKKLGSLKNVLSPRHSAEFQQVAGESPDCSPVSQQQSFFVENADVLLVETGKKLPIDLSQKSKIVMPKNTAYEIKLEVYDCFGLENGICVVEIIKTLTTVNTTTYMLKEEFKSMDKKIITVPKRESIHSIASHTLVSIEIRDAKRDQELFKFQFEYE
eukprot:gene8004-12469_t